MRKNNKGFTLIEMLIVVAIIAILVAVSIPLVNNSLERTRQATDAANERAAKAEAIIMYLNEDPGLKYNTDMYYDASTGKFGTEAGTYGKCKDHKGSWIIADVSEDGEVTIKWGNSGAAHNGAVADNNPG